MTTSYSQRGMGQTMGLHHANAVVARSSFLVCAAPAGQWSPIPAIETTDRKPGRLRRTAVSLT
jgi:hypothetical protein